MYNSDSDSDSISLSTGGLSLSQDWRGETTINLFVEGQDTFQTLADKPQGFPSSYPIKVGDQVKNIPVAYLWKDVLDSGTYHKHSTSQQLQLEQARLVEMVDTFHKFTSNGNVVPIVFKDHKEDRNLGFCIDARLRNGRLELLHQLIGEDAVVEALRNKVSVQIKAKHTDSRNNTYEDCIVHNSLTNDPVVTGQLGWDSIAASRGEQSSSLYIFAASRRSDMTIAELRALLGLGDNVADADVLKAAGIKLREAKDLQTSKQALETEKVALSNKITEHETKITTLTNELNTKKTELVSLSQKHEKRRPSAHELYYAREAINAKREKLISAGTINAATADKIQAKFMPNVDLNTISLSREVTDTDITLSTGLAQTLDVFDALAGGGSGPASDTTKTGDQNKPGDKVLDDKNKSDDKVGDIDKKKTTEFKSARDVVNNYASSRYKGPADQRVQASK